MLHLQVAGSKSPKPCGWFLHCTLLLLASPKLAGITRMQLVAARTRKLRPTTNVPHQIRLHVTVDDYQGDEVRRTATNWKPVLRNYSREDPSPRSHVLHGSRCSCSGGIS